MCILMKLSWRNEEEWLRLALSGNAQNFSILLTPKLHWQPPPPPSYHTLSKWTTRVLKMSFVPQLACREPAPLESGARQHSDKALSPLSAQTLQRHHSVLPYNP